MIPASELPEVPKIPKTCVVEASAESVTVGAPVDVSVVVKFTVPVRVAPRELIVVAEPVITSIPRVEELSKVRGGSQEPAFNPLIPLV